MVGQELHKKTFLDSKMRLAADAEMQFCLRETNLGSGRIKSSKEFLLSSPRKLALAKVRVFQQSRLNMDQTRT